MTGRRVALAAGLAALCVALPAWAATTVRVAVEPRRVAADGTLQFRVVVEGENAGEAEPPSLAHLEDWDLITGPAVSSQFRFVNGVSSTSRSFSWVLAPPGPGTHTIPSLSVRLGGQILKTEAVTVEVLEPPPGARGASPSAESTADPDGTGPEDVFFRTVLEPPEPFVGQQAILRYDLYTRLEVASVPQPQEAPVYPNFWKEDLGGAQRIAPRLETVQGREYSVYTVRKVALFPTASGETTLPPLTFSVPIKSGGTRSRRFRRSFFFDPVETVYKRAPRVTVRVRPLPPEGRPDDFTNAVGRFRLTVEADRQKAKTGDAVGLAVTIEGTGNLNSVKEPTLNVAPGFTVYPPEMRQSVAPDREDQFAGVKSWKYILVAREPGPLSLPEVRFSYFDPDRERYRTLSAGASPIEITGVALADSDPALPARRAIERLGSDIHFIQTTGGPLAATDRPLYRTGWFWLVILVPPLANVSTLMLRWQRRRYRARLGVVRRRKARRTALRRLKQAGASGSSDGGPHFYGALAQALTGYVADKFGGQATGLTYDRIAVLLATNAESEKASHTLLEVLEACDCARFAPGPDDPARRHLLLERASRSILDLDRSL